MQHIIVLAVLFVAWFSRGALAVEDSALRADAGFDPLGVYGPAATYDILRDGELVGSHRISFTRTGDIMAVQSRSDIEVRLLFVTAYNFSYVARSRWRNGELLNLEATTDDNGERSVVRVIPMDDSLVVDGPSGKTPIAPVLPLSEHWWQRFIAGEEQLNTITGAVNRIDAEPLGTAYVPLATGITAAARYRIVGDIQLETWYDEVGRWLGMRFLARDGSTIEYRCRNCRADMTSLASDRP
ncbi:DUF6134 family protein [Dongia sp.]|uniref:DUF6134 family protein n=1 Tax=Dongia sp. TaxID=1977262 RepID=UPI0035B2973F